MAVGGFCRPPGLDRVKLQTEKKQLPLILQNNLVNSLMFVYQHITHVRSSCIFFNNEYKDMIEKLPN